MAMNFKGQVQINAPRETVYEFLTAPDKVAACAAEVQKLDVIDDMHFKVTAKTGVGFVKLTIPMDVHWLEKDAPSKAVARARGSAGGTAVDMTAGMELSEQDGGTLLDWHAEVHVSGTIASVGSRLLEGAANKITGQVFKCVKTKLESPAAAT